MTDVVDRTCRLTHRLWDEADGGVILLNLAERDPALHWQGSDAYGWTAALADREPQPCLRNTQFPQQPSHMPLCYPQFFGCYLLPALVSIFILRCLPQAGVQLLCANRTLSFCGDRNTLGLANRGQSLLVFTKPHKGVLVFERLFCLVTFVALAAPLSAQLTVSTLRGTVTDPAGAVVVNAHITVDELGTISPESSTPMRTATSRLLTCSGVPID